MNRWFAPLLVFIIAGLYSQSQPLPIPRNFIKAYEMGTRSPDGNPGPVYWQNRAEYEIDVTFNPADNKLSGRERIVYYNNSPDTLRSLFFHLYPNLYRKGVPLDYPLDPADQHNGVNINRMTINDNALDLSPEKKSVQIFNTLMVLRLEESLLPSGSVSLAIDWDYPLNKGSHLRTGQVDATTWFIAYFYPHLCVYDDINGWDTAPYTGEQEFYNDFADYTLRITVPGDFLVWATGEWQNPDQILSETYLQRYLQSKGSDQIIPIVTAGDASRRITTKGKSHTWEFKGENVTDVAFALSDHYLWDATSLVVDTVTGRRVRIAAAYNGDSKDFYQVCRIARSAIEKMSFYYPAVPFPFPCMTVFNGLSEMEYPMMVNDISLEDEHEVIALTVHEILHTYFPFYTGTNETKYAWMDEGLTTMGEYLVTSVVDTVHESEVMFTQAYNRSAGDDNDLPLFSTSNAMKGYPYWRNSYTKAAFFYLTLMDYLGKDRFLEALHAFVERWHGKHPTPFDFFYTFNDISGEDLSWLIRPWFFEFGYPDLGIDHVETNGDQAVIGMKKNGPFPVPVRLKVEFADGTVEKIHRDAGIWKDGKDLFEISIQSSKNIKNIELGDKEIPDTDMTNNSWAVK